MKNYLHNVLHAWRGYNPWLLTGVCAALVAIPLIVWWIVRLRRPSAEELERRRRELLATVGRITDGRLLDVRSPDGEENTSLTPEILFYTYRLAGVTYDCAQDVSQISDRVRGYQLDQPLQVKYDPRNPGNSIVVSENWSGLWQI